MFSRNSIYSLPRDGAFPAHVNGDDDHVSRYKSYCMYISNTYTRFKSKTHNH